MLTDHGRPSQELGQKGEAVTIGKQARLTQKTITGIVCLFVCLFVSFFLSLID